MRLHKFLAQAGLSSRRGAEQMIERGQVKINGQVVNKMGIEVDEKIDKIEVDGKVIQNDSPKIYIALHKPVGYISSVSDEQGESIVSLVSIGQKIYPVGRLDKDTSGLIILTNDGDFTNQITHPSNQSEKEYVVWLDKEFSETSRRKLEKGMMLDDKKLQPVRVLRVKDKIVHLVLTEGVNRQIRRQMTQLGYEVVKLKRVRIGNLKLEELKLSPGQWVNIDKNQI